MFHVGVKEEEEMQKQKKGHLPALTQLAQVLLVSDGHCCKPYLDARNQSARVG